MTIYHFRTDFMSISNFRSLLRRDQHGYIDTLIGRDTILPMQFIDEEDVIPPGRIEVAYLPFVFRSTHKADWSALGFRFDNGTIVWLCFDRCIKGSILDAWTCVEETRVIRILKDVDRNDPARLFDPVGELEKGITKRAVRGAHEEHKQFHASLLAGELRNVRIRLGWRGFGKELRRSYEERWEREDREAREREIEMGLQQQQQWKNEGGVDDGKMDEDGEMQGLVRHDEFADENVQDRMDTS